MAPRSDVARIVEDAIAEAFVNVEPIGYQLSRSPEDIAKTINVRISNYDALSGDLTHDEALEEVRILRKKLLEANHRLTNAKHLKEVAENNSRTLGQVIGILKDSRAHRNRTFDDIRTVVSKAKSKLGPFSGKRRILIETLEQQLQNNNSVALELDESAQMILDLLR
jgi:hypothetical protein